MRRDARCLLPGARMPVRSLRGDSPLILALPYTGTDMARPVFERLADSEMFYTAPDRYLDRLTCNLFDGISMVQARFHRFHADVDYPYPQDDSIPVPGMVGVVPLVDHLGHCVWSVPPSQKEATSWRSMFFAPYHAALAAQIARVRALHGHAIVLTCHARPELEAMTEEEYPPDIRISTFMGASSAISLTSSVAAVLKSGGGMTVSLDGRKGTGGTTRTYGRPKLGVHALDLELNERNYLDLSGKSCVYNEEFSAPLREILSELFGFLNDWRPT